MNHFKQRAGLSVLALGAALAFAGPVRADASCDVLFKKIRFVAGEYQALWTTNYYTVVAANPQAPHLLAGKARFMSATELKVSISLGEIVADGRRTMQSYWPGSSVKLPEETNSVRIRIQPDGMVYFDRYGPFNPWCAQDRYMLVFSGDSVEVVSFVVGPYFQPGFEGNRIPPPPPPAPVQ